MFYFVSTIVLPPPIFIFFFFNDTATTEIYTLSLHDALPIYGGSDSCRTYRCTGGDRGSGALSVEPGLLVCYRPVLRRSEEHTSELQSHLNLVCRLLLEKKKKKENRII